MLLEVYRRLAKKHNVTVVTSALKERNRPSVEEILGIKVIRLRTFQERIPIFPMPFLLFDGLVKTLRKENCDVYHINNRYQFFDDTVFTVKSMNKKLAVTLHNALPKNIDPLTDDLGKFYDLFWGRKLMKAADLITGVSTYTINTTVPKSEIYKTHLVLNGVDHKRFRHMDSSNGKTRQVLNSLNFDGGTNILTNGRLIAQKGQIYLLKAFAELVNKENEDINLLLIGKGPLENSFRRFAKKNRLERRVAIIYGIDDDRLPYYYNACKIFALPSLYEPAGLSLLEALSCEIPSVITKVGGMPEIARDSAFYTKPKDYYSIKKRIRYVLENERSASSVAKKGRRRMIKYHDWDKIAKQYERLLLGIIRY